MFAEPKLVAFCAARCLGIDFRSPCVLDATIGSVGHDLSVRRIFLGQWRFQLGCSGAPYPEKRALGLAAVQRHCRHTYGRRRPGVNGNLKLTPFTLKQQSKIDPFDDLLRLNLWLNSYSLFIF